VAPGREEQPLLRESDRYSVARKTGFSGNVVIWGLCRMRWSAPRAAKSFSRASQSRGSLEKRFCSEKPPRSAQKSL